MTLRRFAVAPAPRAAAAPEEHCEFCNARIGPQDRHLLEVGPRKITCACDACALRFEGVVGRPFALIPRDTRNIPAWS